MLPPAKSSSIWPKRRLDRGDVAGAPALCRQLSAGPQRRPPGSRTARRGRRSSGRSPSTGSRPPAATTGNGSCRSATRYSTRSSPSRARACSTIEAEPSSATTEPRGSRSRSISVTLPVPQPASSTRSSPRRSSHPSTVSPHARHGDRQAVVAGGVPISRHHRKATGSPARPGPTAEPQGRYCCSILTIWPPLTRDPPRRLGEVVGLRRAVHRLRERVEVAGLQVAAGIVGDVSHHHVVRYRHRAQPRVVVDDVVAVRRIVAVLCRDLDRVLVRVPLGEVEGEAPCRPRLDARS